MNWVFIIILLSLIVVMTARLCVNLWHSKPPEPLPVKHIGIMLGYILILIGACIAIMKFLP